MGKQTSFFSDKTRTEMEKIPEPMLILRLQPDKIYCEAVTDKLLEFLQIDRERVEAFFGSEICIPCASETDEGYRLPMVSRRDLRQKSGRGGNPRILYASGSRNDRGAPPTECLGGEDAQAAGE